MGQGSSGGGSGSGETSKMRGRVEVQVDQPATVDVLILSSEQLAGGLHLLHMHRLRLFISTDVVEAGRGLQTVYDAVVWRAL